MKTSFRLRSIMSVLAAVSLAVVAVAVVAVAQPAPRNPSDSGAGAGPVPNPGRPGSGYPKPLGQIALQPPDAPPPQHRFRRSSHDAADSSVASVQRALKKRGYYSGPVDGDAGSGTRAPIHGFRRDHGMGYSSRIDGALMRALRL